MHHVVDQVFEKARGNQQGGAYRDDEEQQRGSHGDVDFRQHLYALVDTSNDRASRYYRDTDDE